jgi:predicted transcriptional regulator YheO
MKTTIFINNIEKETEKALCINCDVTFNDNGFKARNIWFPKSVCQVVGEHIAEVEDWFILKVRQQNAFHGYLMTFNTPVTFTA